MKEGARSWGHTDIQCEETAKDRERERERERERGRERDREIKREKKRQRGRDRESLVPYWRPSASRLLSWGNREGRMATLGL